MQLKNRAYNQPAVLPSEEEARLSKAPPLAKRLADAL